VGTAHLEARILDWTLHRKSADGSTHWSSRKLAAQLHVSHMRVARVWAKAGAEFVSFLADVVATQPACKEIHVIADNLLAHKRASKK
jgi:hypothetical protein